MGAQFGIGPTARPWRNGLPLEWFGAGARLSWLNRWGCACLASPLNCPARFSEESLLYAIVRDRSRSLTLTLGQELWVDTLAAEPGSEHVFDHVSLLKQEDGSVVVGTPQVDGASVVTEVLGDEKDKKIYVQHFRRRKGSRDRNGHRQTYTRLRVKEIRNA